MRTWLSLLIVCAAVLASHPARADDGAAKVQVSKTSQLVLSQPISFQVGKDQLAPASDAILTRVARYLADHPKVTLLRIEVHSDARGSERFNLVMSQKRALAIARMLVAKKVSCKRLLPVGFGESKPLVSPERTAQDRARNRRVDLFHAMVGGKPLAGKPIDGGGHIAGDPCAKAEAAAAQ